MFILLYWKCKAQMSYEKKHFQEKLCFFMLNESQFNMSVLKYSNSSIIRLLSLKATSFIWPDFKCTEIVNFYWIAPLKRDHHSYHARCQMHWGSKFLLNCPPQKRPPLLSGWISDALRYWIFTELSSLREATFYCRRGDLIRG